MCRTRALRPRPRIRPRGVMARPHRYAKRCGREYWSVGVLREVRIAPRVEGWRAADSLFDIPVNMVTEHLDSTAPSERIYFCFEGSFALSITSSIAINSIATDIFLLYYFLLNLRS
jgi:hypothetical protein